MTVLRLSEQMNRRNIRILSRSFYNRDTRLVGSDLLGKLLVRRQGRKLLTGRIVEVEAYPGADDPASHTFIGRTPRNAVLFGPPGHAYVYFIYGNYFCLNVSCLPDGVAGGILFRAVEPIGGIEEKDLTDSRSDLYIADDGAAPPQVLVTRRIGIKKAVEMPLRFIVDGNRFVSGART